MNSGPSPTRDPSRSIPATPRCAARACSAPCMDDVHEYFLECSSKVALCGRQSQPTRILRTASAPAAGRIARYGRASLIHARLRSCATAVARSAARDDPAEAAQVDIRAPQASARTARTRCRHAALPASQQEHAQAGARDVVECAAIDDHRCGRGPCAGEYLLDLALKPGAAPGSTQVEEYSPRRDRVRSGDIDCSALDTSRARPARVPAGDAGSAACASRCAVRADAAVREVFDLSGFSRTSACTPTAHGSRTGSANAA